MKTEIIDKECSQFEKESTNFEQEFNRTNQVYIKNLKKYDVYQLKLKALYEVKKHLKGMLLSDILDVKKIVKEKEKALEDKHMQFNSKIVLSHSYPTQTE